MSGSRYLLDTNAIIAYLKGSPFIDNLIVGSEWLGISVISIIEFYSFKNLSQIDKTIFTIFCNRVEVIDISFQHNAALIFQASSIRTNHNLKLPDAVIGTSALINQVALITNDQQFKRISTLQVVAFDQHI